MIQHVATTDERLFRDAGRWRDWLARNAGRSEGIWVVLAKKGAAAATSLSYEQALTEAVCHGWVDVQVRRRDESTYLQRFVPRRERSSWTAANLALAERLAAEGRLSAAGLAALERGRAAGSGVKKK